MTESFIALPPGLDAPAFSRVLARLRDIVGEANVLATAERLAPYTKIMIPADTDAHTPSAALMPASVEQVQQILAVCNEVKVPLWPISTGKNLGYGSAAPATRGQVVLDLKRMNRILEVDADLCTALVEPGVTYQQLHDYIRERNLPLWLSCPAPSAIAGPVGNTLDRGVGYTPYGEHFLFSCGMEVVLATGEILRTGMGSIPNSNTWQVFKWGYGPYLDGLFTQSNYGIVTKLGLWLMPAPPAFKPFVVRYDHEADIEKIVETIRPLRIANVIPNAIVIASALWEAGTFLRRHDYYDGDGSIPDDAVRRIMREQGLGWWNVYAALYGTPEQIEVNWRIVSAVISASGGVLETEAEAGASPVFRYRRDLMRGDMNLQEFGLYNWRGGGGSAWFAPVSQSRGSETLNQMALARRILGDYGFDYVGEFIVGWRDMHHIIDLLFDRTDASEMKRAHTCFERLLAEFTQAGYGTYRVNTAFMAQVADTYGETQKVVKQRLKRALDPNGIIAPGKSGIV
ncbi:MAG: FAD-binding oxidoreductase [Gammaproteobacteria bacterium]|nr:FAD-binding oxidoreductase [Gammaproteobacteria bacterium]